MAVMRWDEQSQAYVEPVNVPMRHDKEADAYVETTGMAYDQTAGAWEEKWSPNKILYLYNEGDECTDVTGGWTSGGNPNTSYYTGSVAPVKGQSYITISPNTKVYSYARTSTEVDFSPYKTICLEYEQTNANPLVGAPTIVISNSETNYEVTYEKIVECEVNTSSSSVDISDISGNFYLFVGAGNKTGRSCNIKSVWLEK